MAKKANRKSTSKSASSKASPVTTHKFVAKKPFKKLDRTFGVYKSMGGVRALVCKSLPKAGGTATQVAQAVAKHRKGYTPQSALNCLRWMQTKGYVARLH
jgi:hypothetical protein